MKRTSAGQVTVVQVQTRSLLLLSQGAAYPGASNGLDMEVDVEARMFEPCTSDQNEATGKSTTSGDHATEHGISAAQARSSEGIQQKRASADSREPTC